MILRMLSPSVSPSFRPFVSVLTIALALAPASMAQAPDVPIRAQTEQSLRAEDESIGKQIAALIAADKLATTATVEGWCKAPQPRALALPKPHTQELAPPSIAELARKAHLRVG